MTPLAVTLPARPAWRDPIGYVAAGVPAWIFQVAAALVAAIMLFAAVARPAYALDRRSGESNIIPAGQVVDDDVALTGRLVRVDGTVRGDVIAFAQHITIAGTVEGDVIAAGQEIVIDGQVLGNVRAAGGTVQINGSVGKNVSSAGQLLRLGSGGRIGGSWIGAGETVSLSGDVGGAIAGTGDNVLMQGRVGRGAELALGTLSLGPNARIGGDLTYHSDKPVNVPPGVVAGKVDFHQVERRADSAKRHDPRRFFGAVANFFSLTWLAGSAVVGLIMLRAFPHFVARFLSQLERRPVPSFLAGVVALVATIPVAILCAITIIGLPVAAILGGAFVGTLFFGWLLLAAALGTILVGLVRRGRASRRPSWAFLLGLLVLYVGTHIPFLGPLVGFVAVSLGSGALLLALYHTWRREQMGGGTAYVGGGTGGIFGGDSPVPVA